MKNEYLRIGEIPEACDECGHALRGRVDNLEVIRTQNGTPYRFRCPDCFEAIEQACPECGTRELTVENEILSCDGCGTMLR